MRHSIKPQRPDSPPDYGPRMIPILLSEYEGLKRKAAALDVNAMIPVLLYRPIHQQKQKLKDSLHYQK